MCCEELVLVEGDVGDHCVYAVVVKIHQVDVCNSNAVDSVDDGVEFLRECWSEGRGGWWMPHRSKQCCGQLGGLCAGRMMGPVHGLRRIVVDQ